MTAEVHLDPIAAQDIDALTRSALSRVIEILDFLSENPLGAQTAGYRKAPDIRRAVAGKYLIYYRYAPEENAVLVYTVRHGARKPPKLKEILTE